LTIPGFNVHERPVGTWDVRTTEPLKPPDGVTKIVDIPLAPGLVLTVFGFAKSEKSPELETMKLRVTDRVIDPLVPVTATAKFPGEGLWHDRAAMPELLTRVGVREQTSGVGGLTALVRETSPANPPMAVTVIVEPAGTCGFVVIVVGKAEIVKSEATTTRLIVMECVTPPPEPVTVTACVPAIWEDAVSVTLWVPVRLVWFSEAETFGAREVVSVTAELKPFTYVTVTVEVPFTPALIGPIV
jgi:hypothetical protein